MFWFIDPCVFYVKSGGWRRWWWLDARQVLCYVVSWCTLFYVTLGFSICFMYSIFTICCMYFIMYHMVFNKFPLRDKKVKLKLKGHKPKRRGTRGLWNFKTLQNLLTVHDWFIEKSIIPWYIKKNWTGSTWYNGKHAFSEPRPFPQVLYLPSLKRHVRRLTAEKTQHCAQGYQWKLDEYLYLPA